MLVTFNSTEKRTWRSSLKYSLSNSLLATQPVNTLILLTTIDKAERYCRVADGEWKQQEWGAHTTEDGAGQGPGGHHWCDGDGEKVKPETRHWSDQNCSHLGYPPLPHSSYLHPLGPVLCESLSPVHRGLALFQFMVHHQHECLEYANVFLLVRHQETS